MKRMGLGVLLVGLVAGWAVPAMAQDLRAMTAAQLEQDIGQAHPSAYYILADKLFAEGEKDKAVFWLYVGVLRYRAYNSCQTDANPAELEALGETIGRPINRYAYGDTAMVIKTLAEVLVWDEANKNDALSQVKCTIAVARTRELVRELRQEVISDAEGIRARRAENGLENR